MSKRSGRNWIAGLLCHVVSANGKSVQARRARFRRALQTEQLEDRRLLAANANISIEDLSDTSAPLFGKSAIIGTDIYFADKDATSGVELWKLDTATDTLSMVVDINPGEGSSDAGRDYLFAVGNKLFFSAYDEAFGNEMRWIDTRETTPTVHTIDVYSEGRSSINFENRIAPYLVVGTKVYFTATDNLLGPELRYVDASADTTNFTTYNLLLGNYGADAGVNGVIFNIGSLVFFQSSIGDTQYVLNVFDSNLSNPQIATIGLDNGMNPSLNPMEEFAVVGSKVYYRMENFLGSELNWIDTSSPFPIPQTLDIDPEYFDGEPLSSDPSDFSVMGNRLFFEASDQDNGREMRWIDTTLQQPVLHTLSVRDGGWSGVINDLVNKNGIVSGDKFFFAASDEATGIELRWIDFAVQNPTIGTIDILNGPDSSNVGLMSNFVLAGNKIYFVATDPASGAELRWVNTAAATLAAETLDFTPGEYGSNVEFSSPLTTLGNKLFFTARADIDDEDLRWIDTTAAQPLVHTIDIDGGSGGSNPTEYLAVGSMLYYVASDYLGRQLRWLNTADDTSGTILTPSQFFYASPRNLTAIGNKVFFTALDAPGVESVYWTSSASDNEVFVVLDNQIGLGLFDNFVAIGTRLFFTAFDDQNGNELRWLDTQSSPASLHTFDISDGASSSITPYVKSTFVVGDDRLYFVATDVTHGQELRWVDASAATPSVHVIEVATAADSSMPFDAHMIYLQSYLYFVAADISGYELRRISGTAISPTLETIDTSIDGERSQPAMETGFGVVGNMLFFSTTSRTYGTELSYIELSAPQTLHILDISLGAPSTLFFDDPQFTTIGSKIYFVANDPVSGTSINWVDTRNGIVTANRFNVFAGHDYWLKPVPIPRGLTAVGDKLFFAAHEESTGFEYHWIDSKDETIEMFTTDVETGPYSSIVDTDVELVQIGSKLFFNGFTFGNGVERISFDINAPAKYPTLRQSSVDEDIVAGHIVTVIDVAMAEQGDLFTFSLVSGAGDTDNASFTIQDNRLIAAVDFDFETKSIYSIRIRAVDQNNVNYERNLVVRVNDLNESGLSELIDINSNANFVNTNAGAGTSVGITAFAEDLDGSNNSVVYSLVSPQDGSFQIDPITGVVTVGSAGLNGQSSTTYLILVEAVGTDGTRSSATFEIAAIESGGPIVLDDDYTAKIGLTLNASDVDGNATPSFEDDGLLVNDLDPQSLSLVASIVENPARGLLNLRPDGTFTYIPPVDAVVGEIVTFTYSVQNSAGRTSRAATVTIELVERGISSFHNSEVPTDVVRGTSPGTTSALDVLAIINLLNRFRGRLSVPISEVTDNGYFYDVNNDYVISPLDLLAIINFINIRLRQGGGEGEVSQRVSSTGSSNEASTSDKALMSFFHNVDDDEVSSLESEIPLELLSV